MIRLLLDQGLPRSAVELLAAQGIDAVHVAQLGMSTSDDEQILAEARTQSATVVTLDADFHALLAMQAATTPSVIRVRIQGLKSAAVAALLVDVIAACDSDLATGAAVTVTLAGIRVRLLPLA